MSKQNTPFDKLSQKRDHQKGCAMLGKIGQLTWVYGSVFRKFLNYIRLSFFSPSHIPPPIGVENELYEIEFKLVHP